MAADVPCCLRAAKEISYWCLFGMSKLSSSSGHSNCFLKFFLKKNAVWSTSLLAPHIFHIIIASEALSQLDLLKLLPYHALRNDLGIGMNGHLGINCCTSYHVFTHTVHLTLQKFETSTWPHRVGRETQRNVTLGIGLKSNGYSTWQRDQSKYLLSKASS